MHLKGSILDKDHVKYIQKEANWLSEHSRSVAAAFILSGGGIIISVLVVRRPIPNRLTLEHFTLYAAKCNSDCMIIIYL